MTFDGQVWEHLPGASRLTLAQRSAIESDAPLLCVVAGAGAGKTRVLTLRVARRVRDGSIEADRTLVTTFSRKAAEELRTRLYSLGVSGVQAGTFHRTALGLLREHRAQRGRPEPQLLAGPAPVGGRGVDGGPAPGAGTGRGDRVGHGATGAAGALRGRGAQGPAAQWHQLGSGGRRVHPLRVGARPASCSTSTT